MLAFVNIDGCHLRFAPAIQENSNRWSLPTVLARIVGHARPDRDGLKSSGHAQESANPKMGRTAMLSPPFPRGILWTRSMSR